MKVVLSIFRSEAGAVKDSSPLPRKASDSISSSCESFPKTTNFRFSQSANIRFPITLSVDGIKALSKFLTFKTDAASLYCAHRLTFVGCLSEQSGCYFPWHSVLWHRICF